MHNKLSNTIKSKIKIFYNEFWNNKLEKLNITDKTLWKTDKSITRNQNWNKIPTLHEKNGLAFADCENAEYYELIHHLTENVSTNEVINRVNKKTNN